MRVSRSLGTKIFLIFGLVLFGVGLVLIGNRHRFFTKTFVVYADFSRLNGIEKGATVRLSGLAAGEVLSTEITKWPEGRLRLKLRLAESLHPYVRTDSIASIRTSGLAGSTFLDIQKGTVQSREVDDGGTLPTVEPLEPADLMREGDATLKQAQVSMKAVQQQADATLLAATSLAQHADGTVVAVSPNLISAAGNFQRAASSVSQLTAGVQQGKGLAGEVLVDPNLARSVAQTAESANQAAKRLNEASARLNASMTEFQQRKLLEKSDDILQNTQLATSEVDAMLATPKGASPASLQSTLAEAQRTLSNLADDTEAAKHNFFLRGFFKDRGYYDLQGMDPKAYRASKFLKGHTRERSWLTAEALFQQGATGMPEILSPGGKAALDSFIGQEIAYLPNNALMVEGYSTGGSPDQNYRLSQERAALVRSYLIARFHLKSDLVGSRPMASVTPAGSDHATWNGISIILLTP